jgi:hypothetical protein
MLAQDLDAAVDAVEVVFDGLDEGVEGLGDGFDLDGDVGAVGAEVGRGGDLAPGLGEVQGPAWALDALPALGRAEVGASQARRQAKRRPSARAFMGRSRFRRG